MSVEPSIDRQLARARAAIRARTLRAVTLLATALSFALTAEASPTTPAQPVKACHLTLIVKFSPEVPNPRDPGFLSSFAGKPGYRLIWRGHSDMSQTLELTGPGPAYRCMREVDRLRNDARVIDLQVVGRG